jgi:TadE-like protein
MGGRGFARQRGQSTVELALSSVVLLLLLLGLLDFARAFYFGVRLQDAARAGARVGVAYDWKSGTYPSLDDCDIKAAVDAVLQSAGMTASQFAGASSSACPPNQSTTCPATQSNPTPQLYSPPYQDSAYSSNTGQPILYICYENSAGLEPPLNNPQGQYLNVIVLYRFGFITGFLQNAIGPGIPISANYEGRIP